MIQLPRHRKSPSSLDIMSGDASCYSCRHRDVSHRKADGFRCQRFLSQVSGEPYPCGKARADEGLCGRAASGHEPPPTFTQYLQGEAAPRASSKGKGKWRRPLDRKEAVYLGDAADVMAIIAGASAFAAADPEHLVAIAEHFIDEVGPGEHDTSFVLLVCSNYLTAIASPMVA